MALRDIESIAKQGRIVAFNAQIVASRSSPSGREFSVVASELSQVMSGSTNRCARPCERRSLEAPSSAAGVRHGEALDVTLFHHLEGDAVQHVRARGSR